MNLKRIIATAAMVMSLSGLATACATGYDGPPYVVGNYAAGTCVSPVTGMPEYCVLMSDGTYQVVPYSIYSTASYGSVLNYTHNHYVVVHTSLTRAGRAPAVSYSSYRSAQRVSAGSYSGMSSRTSRGVVVYGSTSGSRAYRSNGTSVYRSSSGSHH